MEQSTTSSLNVNKFLDDSKLDAAKLMITLINCIFLPPSQNLKLTAEHDRYLEGALQNYYSGKLINRKQSAEFLLALIATIKEQSIRAPGLYLFVGILKSYLEAAKTLLEEKKLKSGVGGFLEGKVKGSGNELTRRIVGVLSVIFGLETKYSFPDKKGLEGKIDKLLVVIDKSLPNLAEAAEQYKESFNFKLDAVSSLVKFAVKKEHEVQHHKEKVASAYNLVKELFRCSGQKDYEKVLASACVHMEVYKKVGKTHRSKEYKKALVVFMDTILQKKIFR